MNTVAITAIAVPPSAESPMYSVRLPLFTLDVTMNVTAPTSAPPSAAPSAVPPSAAGHPGVLVPAAARFRDAAAREDHHVARARQREQQRHVQREPRLAGLRQPGDQLRVRVHAAAPGVAVVVPDDAEVLNAVPAGGG